MALRPTHLSKKGLKFIASEEGFRSVPYNDSAGHATVGYGHLIHYGPVTELDKQRWTMTKQRGLEILDKDSARAAQAVKDFVKVKLSQDQFDALTSFVFNVGVPAFKKSTLLRQLNRGNYNVVPKQLLRWNKAGGKVEPGLTNRRLREGRLFAHSMPRKSPLQAKDNIGKTHFTWRETKSHDGKVVPLRLRANVVRHAKNLEKLRALINASRTKHGLPATGIRILSWYRSPEQNRRVGGAAMSRHLSADATDISLQEIDRLCPWKGGRKTFDALANKVFAKGGFGQYPGGNRHVDSRGFFARWTSWTPGK